MKQTTRLLSALLAVVLASSLGGIPAFGDEADDGAQKAVPGSPVQPAQTDDATIEGDESVAFVGEQSSNEISHEVSSDQTTLGSLHVQVIEGLELNRDIELTFDLTGLEYQESKRVAFSAALDTAERAAVQTPSQGAVSFDKLSSGSYTLTVSGRGFVSYQQNFEVNSDGNSVVLYTGTAAFSQDTAHPGIVSYGDVTGDGVVDAGDIDALLAAIDVRTVAGDDSIVVADDAVCDLNADDRVTLTDLQYAADSLGKERITSTVERTLPADAVDASLTAGSTVGGGRPIADVVGNAGDPLAITANRAISDADPLDITFDLEKNSAEPPVLGGMTVASPQTDNAIASGFVTVEYIDDVGSSQSIKVPLGRAAQEKARGRSVDVSKATATVASDGTIVVDFGGQIAVKKITLTITATSKGTNLTEISRVEFLNDMANKIPSPQMNIPKNLVAQPGSKEFSVSWSAAQNITGYELSISAQVDGSTTAVEEVKRTTATSLTIQSFNNDKIINNTVFTVKVQSVNGSWRSGWSEPITVVPKTDKVPSAPDGLVVKGLYRGFSASWKNMKDTDSYNLFYREKGAATYTKIEGITGSSHQVSGLKDDTEYQVYVTGKNEIGEGSASLEALVQTVNVKPAQLPAYRLINTQNDAGSYLGHIASAHYGRGSMINSPLDEASAISKSALGLFDNSYTSYLKVEDWDEGGAYPGVDKGVTVIFDEAQTLGMISFSEVEDGPSFGYSNVQYIDESGAWKTVGSSIQMRTCENGRKYALVKLSSPITTTQVKLGVGRSSDYQRNVVMAEMRFHAYDSLEADIMGLYSDDLHLVLGDEVTSVSIDTLQKRLDTPDSFSKEYHPYRAALQTELDNARTLLATKDLDDPVRIHADISAQYDKRNLGIGGLNAWQPLGAVAGAGDEIVVYAGATGVATGTDAPLRLVVGQQYHEYMATPKVVATLKAGRNEITIPSLSSTDIERGGQLYIEYTGNSNTRNWGVRVSGAEAVPLLDLYQVTDPAKRLERVTTYVQELESFVPVLKEQHDERHSGGDNKNLNYTYAPETCISNATDIMLDQMMYSVPAEQLLKGVGGDSTDKRASRLLASLDAMDQMMELFYQHKGLLNTADATAAHKLPSQHLNIRYTRMFDGAFMYAAGNHIGIGWGSVPGLCGSNPIELDASGSKVSGNLFGWGIAHEIGHNINQSQYAVVEVTNNYFAQLSATDETNQTARVNYDAVYSRVTSGDASRSGASGTQLAMYWQLRLFYDNINDSAFKLYDSYKDVFANRIFARIDSYARDPEAAPAANGKKLVLGADGDQNIIRLASAAAQRDLTEFFTRWGLIPNKDTAEYLSQFEGETHAVYYENDDARAYARANSDTGAVEGKNMVDASAQANESEITLSLGNTLSGSAAESVLGYEVARLTVAGGQQQREVVGFTTGDSFVDNAASIGNHTVTYEVTAIDKFLNRSAPLSLDAIKITGDGLQDKSGWTATTNMVSPQDVTPPATEDDPDAPAKQPAIGLVLDGKADTVYNGVANGTDPSLVIAMGKSTEVSALRVAFADKTSARGVYRVESSLDGQVWTTLKEGELTSSDSLEAHVYFSNGKDPWICTYDARYLRITAVDKANVQLSIGEISVYGPSGDNVDFLSSEEGVSMGVLDANFTYEQGIDGKEPQFIPKGSIVFTGTYKGNPAYNVVVLYDTDGNIVGGTNADGNLVSNQIIMAPAPGDAMLGETSEGRWVYWINPKTDGSTPTLPTAVRAELYRVDNALTNVGQRLVSDTLPASVPAKLPNIHLQNTSTANPANR